MNANVLCDLAVEQSLRLLKLFHEAAQHRRLST